jgi:hypothetical protein
MIRALILLLPFALTLFTFVDCAMRDDSQINRIPKWGWLLAILFLQPIGGIVYLVIGRNRGPKGPGPRKKRVLPPDDDPDFLRSI